MNDRLANSPWGDLVLAEGYRPGALAEVLALHVRYYAPVWGLGRAFESSVAQHLGSFLSRFDAERDFFLCAYDGNAESGAMHASITIDGHNASTEGARLRWFITSERCRGSGLGRHMLQQALDHCRWRGYPGVHLTTFAGLDAARHLYESVGFVLTQEFEEDEWDSGVREQAFVLKFDRELAD